MAWRGTDDLRGYLKDAVLPEMKYTPDAPPLSLAGHKSHRNVLTVRNRPHRQLHGIYATQSLFDTLVNEWIKERIPTRSLGILDEDHETGRSLSIPSSRKFKTPQIPLPPVSNMERVSSWISHLPLQTAERTMHIIFPTTECWSFEPSFEDDNDINIYREFRWSGTIDPEHPETSYSTITVACQPSWILSSEDLWQFTELRSLPSGDGPLRGKERLWGKLWDSCVRNQSRFFVVTSYQDWVFGAFTIGWTSAFVSPVFNARSRDPTIVEALVYWISTSLGAPGCYKCPEIPEPVTNMSAGFNIPEYPPGTEFVTPADSLSSWSGKSEEPASSAGIHTVMPLDVSDRGISNEDPKTPTAFQKPRDPTQTRQRVQMWLAGVPSAGFTRRECLASLHGGHPVGEPLTSEIFDDASSTSTGSSADTEVGAPQGHWLSMPMQTLSRMRW
ncbi:hypothetical protein BV22DRAFT_21936 [Leucogyrophana mollusca]|uniref:Uncharacterized protein n=1 Tax=Leucogyrophana mollusca TaxID=85980 RepID=A0ACB8BZK8_9AGAM|nr:hypothetical protein BV22DRAFT_21936 [Leucogyrophana mollusca]